MHETEIYQQTLGLKSPWTVVNVTPNTEADKEYDLNIITGL